MKNLLIITLIVLSLAGEAEAWVTDKNQRKILDSWVGKPLDEVVKAWGAPIGTHALSDREVFTYELKSGVNYYCKVSFIINKDQTVDSYTRQGNWCKAPRPKH